MTLLGRLEARKAELQRSRLTKILHDESLQLFNTMRARIEAAQIVDSSGEYKIVNRLYKGRGEEEERNEGLGKRRAAHNAANNGDGGTQGDVTLVTQCSVNHMHHLIGLSERWQGPMSVTVFAPDRHSVIAMEIIVKLFQCVSSFRQNVSVHLVYPFVQAPDMSLVPVTLPTDFSSCVDLHNELLAKWQAKISNYAVEGIKFPNNLLRNVALSNSRTKYVFVVDIDMLPSATLHREFSSFLARQLSQTEQLIDDKTAFVVPAFEISSEVVPPADKTGLLRQWQQHKLRPFYSETCWKCHRWTDYEAWRNLSVSGLEVGYEVEWRDPWEPFYIAPNSVPKYDERFKQYGFNRISQVRSKVSFVLSHFWSSMICCYC